jgi:hypothetical protein
MCALCRKPCASVCALLGMDRLRRGHRTHPGHQQAQRKAQPGVSRRSGLNQRFDLLQQGVVRNRRGHLPGPLSGTALPGCLRRPGRIWPGEGMQAGRRCCGQETFGSASSPFGLEDRAGGSTAGGRRGLQQRPERGEQPTLAAGRAARRRIRGAASARRGGGCTMPEAVQGASSKMASKGVSAAKLRLPPVLGRWLHLATSTCARQARAAASVSWMRVHCAFRVHVERGELDAASRRPRCSSRWAVLPPGAAQASSTRKRLRQRKSSPCSSRGAACLGGRRPAPTQQPSAKPRQHLAPARRCASSTALRPLFTFASNIDSCQRLYGIAPECFFA